MENPTTNVVSEEGKWNRNMYLDIVGKEVIFDTSSEEYGPCYLSLELLEQKIKEHKEKLK